jgi:hypothetical protein
MIDSILRVLDRQGRFVGDLNIVQRTGLLWLMNQEVRERADIERMRIETFALSSNQHTSPTFIKSLFKEELDEPDANEVIGGEWVTPTGPDQIEAFLNGVL